MKNFKIEVQYDGSRYKGWQIQKGNTSTIQGKITDVLCKMENEEIKVIGCGRTDAGVHAESYIANFTSNTKKNSEEILEYLEEYLPEDIVIKSIKEASERFHARYNIVSKTYVYRIDNNKYRNVFARRYATYIKEDLDLDAMKEAAEILVGTHDFKSFTTMKSKEKSTVRTINYINISKKDGIIEVEFNGNGFLQNMVRIIMGTLIEVAMGERKAIDIEEILEAKERAKAGHTAYAHGLTMKGVQY